MKIDIQNKKFDINIETSYLREKMKSNYLVD